MLRMNDDAVFSFLNLGTKEREATQEHEDYRGQWMVTQSCNTSKKHKVLCRQ